VSSQPEGSTSSADGVSSDSVLLRSSEPLVIEPLRHYGRWFAAAVVALLAGALFWSLFTNANIDWSVIAKGVTKRQILNGVWMTIKLTVLSMILGVLLGILSAIAGLSANPVLRTLSTGFTWFFRGTPLLVQIIFWFNIALLFPKLFIPFYGSVSMNTIVSPFMAALLALALNEGAYMSEIVRAGIQSVDRGQNEAAQSLGLSPTDTTLKVILPQAMRVIIPPTGNEVISMLKSTSLVSVIAARDLLTQAQLIYSRTFQVIDYLIVISIWYLILTTILTLGQRVLEKRFGRGFGASVPARNAKINFRERLAGA
jgi:polar amino acid transport system permease protein